MDLLRIRAFGNTWSTAVEVSTYVWSGVVAKCLSLELSRPGIADLANEESVDSKRW